MFICNQNLDLPLFQLADRSGRRRLIRNDHIDLSDRNGDDKHPMTDLLVRRKADLAAGCAGDPLGESGLIRGGRTDAAGVDASAGQETDIDRELADHLDGQRIDHASG